MGTAPTGQPAWALPAGDRQCERNGRLTGVLRSAKAPFAVPFAIDHPHYTVYGGAFFPVGGLNEQYASQLFKRHYPGHNPDEDDLLRQLITDVEYNTLVIELLAKNLDTVNQMGHYSLAELVRDIQQSLVSLRQSGEVGTTYHAAGHRLRVEKPEHIVMAMYDLEALSEAEKQMISVFALLPNKPIDLDFLTDCFDPDPVRPPLRQLAQKGWVDFDTTSRQFKVNQVVQDVALLKQKNRLLEDAHPVISFLSESLAEDHLLHHQRMARTLQLVVFAQSIVGKLSEVSYDIGLLYQHLGNYYQATGDISSAFAAYESMLTNFQSLTQLDPNNANYKNGLAISYSKLGDTQAMLGNLVQALQFFEKYRDLKKQLFDEFPNQVEYKNGLAISYSKLGTLKPRSEIWSRHCNSSKTIGV